MSQAKTDPELKWGEGARAKTAAAPQRGSTAAEMTDVLTPKAAAAGALPTGGAQVAVFDAKQTRTTFPVRQRAYRDLVCRFFSDPENYKRLERIAEDPRMCSTIFYYVKEFEPDRLVRTETGIFRVCDEYRNAIANFKKRYYNFESKAGSGELVWEGAVNPPVVVNEAYGPDSVAMPLPRLVALYWFVQNGFDHVFWDRLDDIRASYEAFTAQIKRKYTDTHKRKKAERRRKFEEEVIDSRGSPFDAPPQCVNVEDAKMLPLVSSSATGDATESGSRNRSRKPARLTRMERKVVAQKIEQDKQRRREMRTTQRYKRDRPNRNTLRPKELKGAVLIDAIGGEAVKLT